MASLKTTSPSTYRLHDSARVRSRGWLFDSEFFSATWGDSNNFNSSPRNGRFSEVEAYSRRRGERVKEEIKEDRYQREETWMEWNLPRLPSRELLDCWIPWSFVGFLCQLKEEEQETAPPRRCRAWGCHAFGAVGLCHVPGQRGACEARSLWRRMKPRSKKPTGKETRYLVTPGTPFRIHIKNDLKLGLDLDSDSILIILYIVYTLVYLFTICICILNFQLLSCCMATACCWDGSQAAVEAEVDVDAPPVEGPALDPREELKEWPEFVSCLATNYQIPSHEVCFDFGNFLDFRLQEFQWWRGGFSVFPFFHRLTKEVSGAVQFSLHLLWGIKVEPTDRWWGSWTVLKPLGVQQPGRSTQLS